MSIEKKIFSVKKNTNSTDLKKRWYILAKVVDYKKGQFKWVKLYGDINKYPCVQSRIAECDKMIAEINATGQYFNNQGAKYINPANDDRFLSDTITQFYQALENKKIGLRSSTYSKYKGQIKVFEYYLQRNQLKHLALGKLNFEIVKDFLDKIILQKKQCNNTYNSYLTLFKGFYNTFVKQQKVNFNPFEGIKKLPKNSVPAAYFNKELATKIKNIAAANEPQLWLFIQFIYYCFIRPKELRMLQVKHIDFENKQIFIPAYISKNKKNSYVALPNVLFEQVQSWVTYDKDFYLFSCNGLPCSTQIGINTMKVRHSVILKNIGAGSEYKLYGWKHTGAVNFTRAGGSLKDLQLQLRHHSLDQVNQYMQSMTANESVFIKEKFPIIA